MFIRAKTLHCSIKNVRNWFGYQRKMYLKRGEKTEVPQIKAENVSKSLNTPMNYIPLLKNQEAIYPMKEETNYSRTSPIIPMDSRNLQGFVSPFSQRDQHAVYQNKACMNNIQFFNQRYAMLAAMMSTNSVPPFGFNFHLKIGL